MRRTFKYRIYANKVTIAKAEKWLELCRNLYNCALEERKVAWSHCRKTIFYNQQQNEMPEIRKLFPEYKDVDSQVLRTPLHRVDLAFRGFFARIKRGEKPGYPRFKGKGHFNAFTLEQNGWVLDGRFLSVRNVGRFKMRLSRPIQGRIKSIDIKRSATDKWYATFNCDFVPQKLLPESDKIIGLDVGIKSFCVDSDGNKVNNPLYFKRSLRLLRLRNRRMCRRSKLSNRRRNARILAAKVHEKVANQRRDFLYKLANSYISKYGTIVVEKLNMNYLEKSKPLARSVFDSSWIQFFQILSCKAEEAGRIIIKVNPRNTSQNCSRCGQKVEKTLAVRTHSCPFCGLVMDRDENAARNILALGQSVQALT